MGHTDPLVSCLVYLTRYFETPYSADVIRAGLALTDEQLGVDQLEKAAGKAGLAARFKKQSLKKIKPADLPAILLLNDDAVCVCVGRPDKNEFKVFYPKKEAGESETQTLSLTELNKSYTGTLVSISKAVQDHPGLEGETQTPSAWPGWFFKAFAPHWWTYLQVILAALMVNLFALASPLFIMNVYDRVLPNNSITSLWVMATGILIVFGFDFLIKNLRSFFIDYAGKRVDTDLSTRLVDQVLDMQMTEKPASSGEYANLLRELETLRDFFTSATLLSLIDLPFVFIFIVIFWIIAGPLALVLVVTLCIILILGVIFHIPLQRAVKRAYNDGHRKHAVLVETVGNLETIKSIRGEGRFRKLWHQAIVANAATNTRTRLLSQFVVNSAAFIQQLAYISIVIYGVYLITAGRITTGALIACVILNGRAMAPLGQITLLLTRLHHAYTSLKGLHRLMQKKGERPQGVRFLHRPDLKAKVEFNAIDFSYPGAQIPALKKINFQIQPGEKVGLIGRSGSGKTTIGKLILGLFPTTAGAICIDDTDIRQIDPVDLRRITGVVTQDVTLFKGTVRENILMANPRASDEQVLSAAGVSGVDDFIRQHPSGYDLVLNERGEGISGGQRQAIGVARALVNNPSLLIMDEPTAAMDNSSEDLLKNRLTPHIQDKTLILITHRVSLLELVDRLIVLDNGQVVADGPKQLILEQLSQNKIKVGQ